MSGPTSGLLPALVGYYRRLEEDPAQDVAELGFRRERVHFQVVLEPDGSLASFDDIRERDARGKPAPASLLVPDVGGRSGRGFKPFFCWDHTGYALGRDGKGNAGRASVMFAAFRDLHRSFRDELAGDEGFAALCRFLDAWDPARAGALPHWDEAAGLNVVFRLRARGGYVHQSEAVRAAWSRRVSATGGGEERVVGESLLNGEKEELARLHPHIRGVVGASTAGASIVSFNLNAFESYGKSQSYNAPVGRLYAFRYTTALNRLLADHAHRTRIGDATVVFWSDRAGGEDAEAIFRQFIGDDATGKESDGRAATSDRFRKFLDAARQGRLADQIQDPDAPFYVLGLSPNAGRLSVRYWLAGTVREFAERLARHAECVEIIGSRGDEPPLSIRRLLLETAREAKDIPPQLAGEVARAVLGGLSYPHDLFHAVVRRTRADRMMNHRRAAILKAYLIQNRGKEVSVALNRDHPDDAYQLGRLLAALERTQKDSADGRLSPTIRDRFFGSACATPANVFPRLLRLHQHHLNRLEDEGVRLHREQLVDEICARFERFPAHLPLEKQGLFCIGYYHQRQDLVARRPESLAGLTHE